MDCWCFAVIVFLSMMRYVHNFKGFTGKYFVENKMSYGQYPTNKVILKALLKSKLTCACMCLMEARCVAFLYDGLQCYVLETRMHEQIVNTTAVTDARYYEMKGELKVWRIQVLTGSHLQAGTNNYVYITIYGTAGATKPMRLDDPNKNDFERGNLDTFDITVDDFGVPWRVKITFEIKTSDLNWQLNRFTLCDSVAQNCYNFNADVWLSPSTSMTVVLEQDK